MPEYLHLKADGFGAGMRTHKPMVDRIVESQRKQEASAAVSSEMPRQPDVGWTWVRALRPASWASSIVRFPG